SCQDPVDGTADRPVRVHASKANGANPVGGGVRRRVTGELCEVELVDHLGGDREDVDPCDHGVEIETTRDGVDVDPRGQRFDIDPVGERLHVEIADELVEICIAGC